MKPLVEYCHGVVRALSHQYEATNVLGHAVTAGAARESLIKDFLQAHLPGMTNILSGMILDSYDGRSRQLDIVLVLKSMPRLPFSSGHDLIFQEGVVATFEIKTEISPSDLSTIASNIASVSRLRPSSLGSVELGDLDWPYDRVLNVVVTYGGSDLGVIERAISKLAPGAHPDVYLDLSQGILIKNEGIILPALGEDSYLFFRDPAIGLARLLVLLSKITGRLIMRDVKWEKYIV